MALLTIDHFSESLGLSLSCLVILPQQTTGQIGMSGADTGDERYPTLWLLHGKSDDHSIWLRRTSIERYVAPLGMAVVMPSVHLSCYANMAYGGRYWDYVSAELPELLERWLPVATTRDKRYVAGLSMGGWGTMKLALNCPERFCAAASLSGALRLDFTRWRPPDSKRSEHPDFLDLVYGPGPDLPHPEDRLLQRVKEHVAASTPLPRLYACCGTEDFLLEDNRDAVRRLRETGVSIDYEEGPGAHTWAFWDGWIQRSLAWMGFDITPPELGAVTR